MQDMGLPYQCFWGRRRLHFAGKTICLLFIDDF